MKNTIGTVPKSIHWTIVEMGQIDTIPRQNNSSMGECSYSKEQLGSLISNVAYNISVLFLTILYTMNNWIGDNSMNWVTTWTKYKIMHKVGIYCALASN